MYFTASTSAKSTSLREKLSILSGERQSILEVCIVSLYSSVFLLKCIFTVRKRSLRRLCFYTCLSVILFTGGVCLSACWEQTSPRTRPPWDRHTPREQAPPWDQTLPESRHPPWQTATAADSTHPTGMHSFKQECIPVGCILTTAVAATRCQYQGVGQTPPPNKRHIPGGRPLFRGRPSPCGQTNASGNITFPCGQ